LRIAHPLARHSLVRHSLVRHSLVPLARHSLVRHGRVTSLVRGELASCDFRFQIWSCASERRACMKGHHGLAHHIMDFSTRERARGDITTCKQASNETGARRREGDHETGARRREGQQRNEETSQHVTSLVRGELVHQHHGLLTHCNVLFE